MSGTTHQIHVEKQPHTITRFYHYMLFDWNVTIYSNGSWKAEKGDDK